MSTWIEIYVDFLNTPRPDWSGKVCKPLRSSVVNSMLSIHELSVEQRVSKIVEDALASGRRVFAWSDQHINHRNIIQYANRPFSDFEVMNEFMLSNYKSTVEKDDLVIFGGDISFGPLTQARELVAGLPGEKILVLGNHEFDQKFRDHHIFDHTVMGFSFTMPDGQQIGVSHLPVDANMLPDGWLNLHGHTHQHLMGEKHINMAVEHTNFSPENLFQMYTKHITFQPSTSMSRRSV